jgi:hypothetical protein
MPVHVGASHSSRDGWDLQEQGSSRVAVAGEGGTSFGRVRLALGTPNPNPRRRRRRVPWYGKVPGAEESSTKKLIQAMLLLSERMEAQAGPSDDSLVGYDGFFFGFFRFENVLAAGKR